MKKLNVGISISATQGANIWANGINQNIALLGQLLLKSPALGKVWFLNGGDAEELPAELAFNGIDVPLVRPQEVTHDIDIVIEMGAILPIEWMRHVHACGGPCSAICSGVSVSAEDWFPIRRSQTAATAKVALFDRENQPP